MKRAIICFLTILSLLVSSPAQLVTNTVRFVHQPPPYVEYVKSPSTNTGFSLYSFTNGVSTKWTLVGRGTNFFPVRVPTANWSIINFYGQQDSSSINAGWNPLPTNWNVAGYYLYYATSPFLATNYEGTNVTSATRIPTGTNTVCSILGLGNSTYYFSVTAATWVMTYGTNGLIGPSIIEISLAPFVVWTNNLTSGFTITVTNLSAGAPPITNLVFSSSVKIGANLVSTNLTFTVQMCTNLVSPVVWVNLTNGSGSVTCSMANLPSTQAFFRATNVPPNFYLQLSGQR